MCNIYVSGKNGPDAGLLKLRRKSKLGRKRCDWNGTSGIVPTCFYYFCAKIVSAKMDRM